MRPLIGRKQAATGAAPGTGDLPSQDRRRRARRWVTVPVWFSLCALLVAASATQVGSATAARAQPGASQVPTVNWALSGQATSTTSQSGNPPANAIDGNAATSWCTDSWPDTLTVDLGQVRNLDGIGITLDSASSSANATISVATQQGDWHTLPTARNIALDPGNPMYLPLGPSSGQGKPPSMSARYAQIEVWDSGSTPVCIGEFRLFGPDPAAANMMLGSDLSFTPQELAAGPSSPTTASRATLRTSRRRTAPAGPACGFG